MQISRLWVSLEEPCHTPWLLVLLYFCPGLLCHSLKSLNRELLRGDKWMGQHQMASWEEELQKWFSLKGSRIRNTIARQNHDRNPCGTMHIPHSQTDRATDVCMHACMHVRMHTCIDAYRNACRQARMHAYVHVYMHACLYACMYVYMYNMHTCMYAFICMYIIIYAYMHACAFREKLHVYVCTYTYVWCTYIRTYIRTYIYTYVCTYIHKYTFIRTCIRTYMYVHAYMQFFSNVHVGMYWCIVLQDLDSVFCFHVDLYFSIPKYYI